MKKTYSMLIVLAMALVMALSMSAAAFADEGDAPADGKYLLSQFSGSLGMVSNHIVGTPTLEVNGEDAVLMFTADDSVSKRFAEAYIGQYSSITEDNKDTIGTKGTVNPDKTITFRLPMKTADVSETQQIEYVMRYKNGYSATHDGDWYKSTSSDFYYFQFGALTPVTATPLTITNNTGMFKAVTAALEEAETDDGAVKSLVIALSGTGYRELFKGTYEEAVANGEHFDNWIHGYINADGKYEFVIPFEDKEDKKDIAVTSISNSYYEKYLDGANTLDRAFYPRQLNVDKAAGTLVTGDYDQTLEIAITNNVSMFKPHATASVHIVGGPNSNTYEATMTLPMDSANLNNVKVGETIIPLNDDQTFENIPVTPGKLMVMEFQSKNNGNWYKRDFTLDLVENTGVFNPHQATVDEIDDMDMEEAIAFVKANANVTLLNALIEAIQVQERDDNTDKYCAAAKACWDALSAEDKLEDDGYFSDDTGDASLDDPLNTLPDKKRELLVVSFGTSFNDSRVATIGAVEKALQKAYPLYAVRRAFTAQIIINHIASRDGEQIDNVKQAMDKAVEAGVKTMIVQPTHLMSGYEYDELKAEIDKYADKIHISYAKPLLDSDEDKIIVAKALADEAAAQAGFDSVADAAAKGTAFVFMGHGTSHEASATYDMMQAKYAELGYANCFVGTVEGIPEDTALPAVKEAVEDAGYTKVILRPMMVVAGDHANNDMAADEEGTWYYGFAYGGEFEVEGADEAVEIGEGFGPENVDCQINGLGEIKAVQDLYIAHTRAVAAEEDPITKTEEFIKFIKDYVLQYIQSEDARAAYDWITGQYDSYKAIADLILEYPEAINVYGEWLDEYIKEVNKYAQAFQESPEVQAAVDEVIAKAEELKKLLDEYEISSADDLIAKIKEAKEELEKAVEDFIASVNEEMISEAIDALIEKAVENGFDPAIIDQIEDIIDQAKEIAGMSQDELLEKALEAAFEAFEMLEDGEFDEYLEAAGLEPQFVKDLVDDVLSYAIGYMFGDTYNAVTDRLYDALDELEETKAEVEKLKQALADAKKAGDDRAEIIKKFKNGYKVQNKKPTIKKVKNLKKKKIKVTFKGLKGVTATKYQIQAKAKKAKTKKAWVKKSTTSAKKLNKTLKKLKKGKKYTVKVRALYQFKYQGKTYKFWSKWSKAKKVKVKK